MRSAVAAGIGMFLGIIALKNAGIVVASEATFVDARGHDAAGAAAGDARLLPDRRARRAEGQGRDPDRHPRRHRRLDRRSASASSAASWRRRRRSRRPSCSSTSSGALGERHLPRDPGLRAGRGVRRHRHADRRRQARRAPDRGPGHTNPQLGKALLSDSTAIVAGSLLGTSSTTAYVESAAGVQAGGRTGLTAVTVARPLPARRCSSRRSRARSRPSPPRRRCSTSPA